MKVGVDARAAKWYRGTGIGTYTYQLINSLNKIDSLNEYVLFTSNDSKLKINLSNNLIESCFWDEVKIPNIIQGKDIDLYHVPQNGVGIPKNKKCHYVITLHDIIPIRKPETVSERYLKIFNEELPELLQLCDGIITVSNFSKKDIMEAFNFPENKIYVTYLAAEDIYRPMNKLHCKYLIKKRYSIKNNFILYIGGFSPRKNIQGLIEAYSLLPNKIKEKNSLVIAGNKGISFEKYKNICQQLGIEDKVIFPGFIPMTDIPVLYNAAEVFVYPSFYEGFGLPPLEAMACGTAVITSNITAMPEIYGNSCILADPFEKDNLASEMEKILTSEQLKKELSIKGIQKASEFSWKTTAQDTVNIYNKIIYGHET